MVCACERPHADTNHSDGYNELGEAECWMTAPHKPAFRPTK